MKTNSLPPGIPEHPLKYADEAVLARHIQKYHREEDVVTLAMHSLCEAIPYVCTVSKGLIPLDEVLSFCYCALLHAARNFKPGRTRFFCYAKVYLRSELSKWWKCQDVVANSSLHEAHAEDEWRFPIPTADADYEKAEPEFELVDLKERWEIVKPLLQKLTERERLVLELVYLSGFSYTKISKLLVPRISREAVHCCHHRALRKLQLALCKLNRTITI